MGRLDWKIWKTEKRRALERKALEDRDTRLWHSHSYHRYFEGYTEYTELDGNGKERIRRIYTAAWYEQDLPRGKRLLVRLLYAFLYLSMAVAVVLAGCFQGASGTGFYIALPELFTLCCLSWLGYVLLVNYDFAPRRMTIHDYKSSSGSVIRFSLVLSMAFLLDAGMTVLEIALGGKDLWRVAGLFLLGAACAFGMWLMEKSIPYKEIENSLDEERGVRISGEYLQG